MFESFRRSADALQKLVVQMTKLRQLLEDMSRHIPQEAVDFKPVTERLDRLEVGYAKWQAEAEATLLKADALFKNARNAEERARSKAAKADEDSQGDVESEEFLQAYQRWIDSPDAEGALETVRDVAQRTEGNGSRKALAVRAKFR